MRGNVAHYWYRRSFSLIQLLLWPFSGIFAGLVAARKWCYQRGLFSVTSFNVPVIVVGNITVGGTGKTPLVIGLVQILKAQGYRPGIVSRGYGGASQPQPYLVSATDLPATVGDEALLLAIRTHCPVVVCTKRVLAAAWLLKHTDCNIIISDDGLQHYALARDIEIAVLDGERQLGNGYLLPAGPLREPPARLQTVDMVVINGQPNAPYCFSLQPAKIVACRDANEYFDPASFPHRQVHAVAGIGHPERFFNTLKMLGFEVTPHIFPDHYAFQTEDLNFEDQRPVIMTEKDAVKCKTFAKAHHWYLVVDTVLNQTAQEKLLHLVQQIRK